MSIDTYGLAKREWLKQFLKLPNGIPSHDTFARVFARLNPQQFQQCFLDWIKSIYQTIKGEVIAIDGKFYVILMMLEVIKVLFTW